LILLAVSAVPSFPLVVAANRDELYDRPSQPAGWWPEAPELLAGRDLRGGGTWLGVTRSGRFAAVTNYREPLVGPPPGARSRGNLVRSVLTASEAPSSALEKAASSQHSYGGFNLIAGTFARLLSLSNRGSGRIEPVQPGWHGLSNRVLDTPWPKVRRGLELMRRIVGTTSEPNGLVDRLLELLSDRRVPDDAELPDTGVGLELERALGRIFIEMDGYGTRSSTVLLVHRDGWVTFAERTFDAGAPAGTVRETFELSSELRAQPF
jgi:uncharacterized protein with NRDE domain